MIYNITLIESMNLKTKASELLMFKTDKAGQVNNYL